MTEHYPIPTIEQNNDAGTFNPDRASAFIPVAGMQTFEDFMRYLDATPANSLNSLAPETNGHDMGPETELSLLEQIETMLAGIPEAHARAPFITGEMPAVASEASPSRETLKVAGRIGQKLVAASVVVVTIFGAASVTAKVIENVMKPSSRVTASAEVWSQNIVTLPDITIKTVPKEAPVAVIAPTVTTESLQSIAARTVAANDKRTADEAAATAKIKQEEAAKAKAAQTIAQKPAAEQSLSANQALAHQIASAEFGYTSKDLACLDDLWGKNESGYKAGILNPGSKATGIPQALPGDKIYGDKFDSMETYHDKDNDWVLKNPDAEKEIRWGLKYIVERTDYKGDPCVASNLREIRGWY